MKNLNFHLEKINALFIYMSGNIYMTVFSKIIHILIAEK